MFNLKRFLLLGSQGDKKVNLKRFLLVGSLGLLLFASLVFVFSPKAPSAHAASNNSCPPGLSENASSNDPSWVEVLKFALNSVVTNSGGSFTFSSFPLPIDGGFGSGTKTAVVAFQRHVSLSYTGGAVGDQTWTALNFCNAGFFPGTGNAGTTCPAGQSENSSTNTPVFVEAIQDLLNQAYTNSTSTFSHTSPDPWTPFLANDGSFGPQTHNAVDDWQAHKGISSGFGAVGDRTWRSLGMCF